MALSKDEILEAIKELPVIELAGLVKDLEEEFGVSAAAAAPVAVAAAQAQLQQQVMQEDQMIRQSLQSL